MKKILLLAAGIIATVSMNAQQCDDLMISEYIEGNSQNKGIEIYNPTANPISLAGYTLVRFSNGSNVPTDEVALDYVDSVQTIQPYDVVFVVNGQTVENDYGVVDPVLYDLADIAGQGEYGVDPMYFNGNDAVAILKNGNTELVDLFGKIGEDPGNGWCDADSLNYIAGDYFWLSWSSNHTLIRKPSVTNRVVGNPSYFNPAEQYDSLPQNTWDHIGYHDCECDPNYNGVIETNNVQEKEDVVVYPNPIQANSQFTIMASQKVAQVEFYSIIGTLEKTLKLSSLTGLITTDASDLNTGMYLMRVTFADGKQQTSQLLIK
ncbi:MAG: hypothetical protein C0599_16200 [Salinivirgaceae bacterium]|nr:MAG: hypothetical protein C0599_16200 [Salinivirgaceae bacterium]